MGKSQCNPTSILNVCFFIWKYWEERPRKKGWGLWTCLIWRKGSWAVTSLLSTASWGSEVERWTLLPGSSAGTCRNGSKLSQGTFRLHIFLSRRWSNNWPDLLRQGWCPCQCSRVIWTMPLTRCFNLVSPEWVKGSLQVPSNWDNLFYSNPVKLITC